MSKFQKAIALLLVVALTAALSVSLTMAYLQHEDSDVNVMTLGNVKIKQIEQERDEKGGLQDFTQEKPAYPAVGPIEWAEKGVDVNGTEYKVFTDELKNVVDKIITVENTGKSDAYVRTIIAIEAPDFDPNDLIHVNINPDGLTFTAWTPVEVGDVDYVYAVFTYNAALKPDEISAPSLLQVFLDSKATNEDVAKFGDTWDIIAISQAVQTKGFADAKTALDTAFGAVDATNAAQWVREAQEEAQKEKEPDTWDGTADTSWYNDTDTEFVIMTAEQLAGFSELVDGGNTFEGKTVKLGKNIDLYYLADGTSEPKSFDPIGDKSAFAGTLDGQGYTISNLYQSGWAFGYEWGKYGSIGLFGELESATVKNLTLSGAESFVEGGDVGGITGSATGTCVFENITIEDSVFATYNNGNGGIIGWSGAGNYTFKNVTIAENTVLAGLWGSFDSSIGGIVGQGEPGATYNFENVDIACRLDVYNDCTASYDYYNYRMCGMIIGRLEETTTIDGSNYPDTSKYNITCNNVTVTYGDWMNYHYCEPTPGYNNGRGMRVEPGYSYGGLPEDFDHSQCTTNHNTLIPFDQIFGGAQYGVKGLKTYDGVNVVYNNK